VEGLIVQSKACNENWQKRRETRVVKASVREGRMKRIKGWGSEKRNTISNLYKMKAPLGVRRREPERQRRGELLKI